MEEKESELQNLIPSLQQATTLIECTSVARNGLSANFYHMEQFFHSISNPPGPQEHTDHDELIEQNSGYHHIRQISTETQASSRLSTEVSDCEMELEQVTLLNQQTLKELHKLTTSIRATYTAVDSNKHSSSNGVPAADHHEMSGNRQHPATNTYTHLVRPVSQSDSRYNHLSNSRKNKEPKNRSDGKENAYSRAEQGRSLHIRKKFNIEWS